MIPRFYRLLKYTPGSEIRPVAEVSGAYPVQSSSENYKADSHEELFSRQNIPQDFVSLSESKMDKVSSYSNAEHVSNSDNLFHVSSFWEKRGLRHFLSSRWMLAFDASEEAANIWAEALHLSKIFKADLSGVFIQADSKIEIKVLEGVEVIRSKHIAKSILEAAQRKQASLVWAGTHARKGKERVKKGSIAEILMKEALCPVWIDKGNHSHEIKNILLPFDDLKNLELMLKQVAPLLHELHANLYLLHVSRKDEPDLFKDISLKLSLQGEWDVLEKRGELKDEILQVVKEKEIDLIVMATHYESEEEKILPSGLTVEIMREAPCSLLILKHL